MIVQVHHPKTSAAGRAIFPTHPKMTQQERVSRRKQLVKKYGDRCARCGWKDSSYVSLDHVVPRARGGNNSLHNLQLLCLFCNELKGDTIADYRCAA